MDASDEPQPGERAGLRWLVLLALLTVGAFGLRLIGLDGGLPHWVEPDAEIASQVEYFRGVRGGEKRWLYYRMYPHVLGRATEWTHPDPWPSPERAAAMTLEEHLAAASATVLQVRWMAALMSSLVVLGTFWLARRFVSPGWALAAAAAAGLSLLNVNFAQQARPHAPSAAFVVLTLAAAVRMRRRGDAGSYLLAGTLCGLALGTLHSAIALGLPLAAAHLLRERRRLFDPRLLLALAPVVASVVAFYPWLFAADPTREGPRVEEGALVQAGHTVAPQMFNGDGTAVVARTLWQYEPALLVGTLVAALVLALVRPRPAADGPGGRGKDAAVVAAYVLPYLGMLLAFEGTYERFVLPLVAPLVVFVVAALARLASLGMLGRAAAALGAIVVVGLPAASSTRLVRLRAEPDTLSRTAAWLEAELDPASAQLFLPTHIDLPLANRPENLPKPGRGRSNLIRLWRVYQANLPAGHGPEPLWDLAKLVPPKGIDYQAVVREPDVLIDALGDGYYVIEVFAGGRQHASFAALRAALARRGERVLRVSPDADPELSDHPIFWQWDPADGWPHFTMRLFGARCVGPVVEVYRVGGGADGRDG